MQLFIANGTHQHQTFMYRVPEVAQVRQQTIRIGEQIRISGDLSQRDVDYIIDQHAKYGLIAANEIEKGAGPAPLAYSVDKPVSSMQIELLTRRNLGVLVERGKETRKNAAIVMATELGRSVQESGTGVELGETEVDITEDLPKGARAGEDQIAESIVANREDRQGSSRARRRGR